MSAPAHAVIVSGHDSAYRFDGPDPRRPLRPLLSLACARADARWWNGHADTIGGHALVVHVPTGRCFDAAGRRMGSLRDHLWPEAGAEMEG